MKQLVKKHPLAIRWFHWLNFPLLAIMVWSGTLTYWANAVYRIGIGNRTLLRMTVSADPWKRLGISWLLGLRCGCRLPRGRLPAS